MKELKESEAIIVMNGEEYEIASIYGEMKILSARIELVVLNASNCM